VKRILGDVSYHTSLVSAAYAESTWKKIDCALNLYDKFCKIKGIIPNFSICEENMSRFINYLVFERKVKSTSVIAYFSHLKLIHKLRNLNTDTFKSFICKTQIRGAENLQFYCKEKSANKKVMTLPLLRILGHAVSTSNTSNHAKVVLWAAYCMAFFGSYRPSEILAKKANVFNEFETLLWSDVKFIGEDSIQVHNKVTKNRAPGGEYVSLFVFPFHGCCPVSALKLLAKLADSENNLNSPVFKFESGTYLTKKTLIDLIFSHLEPFLGSEARNYSCKSFRAALPSALASCPHSENDKSIKQWGRWNSDAFERYIRLSHKARRKLFARFAVALNSL
jgi:hypothetical protein